MGDNLESSELSENTQCLPGEGWQGWAEVVLNGTLETKSKCSPMNGPEEEAAAKFIFKQALHGPKLRRTPVGYREAARWGKLPMACRGTGQGKAEISIEKASRVLESGLSHWDGGWVPRGNEKPLEGICTNSLGIITWCLKEGHVHWQSSLFHLLGCIECIECLTSQPWTKHTTVIQSSVS